MNPYTSCKPLACSNINNHHKKFSTHVHHIYHISQSSYNHINMLKTKKENGVLGDKPSKVQHLISHKKSTTLNKFAN